MPALTREEADMLIEKGEPTERERAMIAAVITHGSSRNAAAALGGVRSGYSDAVDRVRKRAIEQPWPRKGGDVRPPPGELEIDADDEG